MISRQLTDHSAHKTAFVVGASKGLGLTIVKKLINEGWAVGTFSRTTENLTTLAHDDIDIFKGDATEFDGLQTAICTFSDRHEQKLSRLIFVAGAANAGHFTDIPKSELQNMFSLNVLSPAVSIQSAIPFLENSGHGEIFLASSVSALHGTPGFAMYSASKTAISAIAEALSLELEPKGIKVFEVVLGSIGSGGIQRSKGWRKIEEKYYSAPVKTSKPYTHFKSISVPMDPAMAADLMLKDTANKQSGRVYLPKSIRLLSFMFRFVPGYGKFTMRLFFKRRLSGMLSELSEPY